MAYTNRDPAKGAPTAQQQASAGEVAEWEPVSIAVDRVFDLLQEALNKAIEAHGNKAKAFAWDVKGHFLSEIGHYRARVTVAKGGE